MDGLAGADVKGVVAPLVFLVPMTEKPVAYNYEPPPGIPQRTGRYEAERVLVRDARTVANELSLDRQGFVLINRPTAAKDLYSEDEIASVYYPECEQFIKDATGAARVVAFDHIVRNEAKAVMPGSDVKLPSNRIHNDYTARSAPQRVRDLLGDEAEELLKHRFAIINLWRPIAGPLLRAPLALGDASSLGEENLISSDLRYPDRIGETQSVTYDPSQRYFYFPRMQPQEAVLIRCFDSSLQGPARFSAHGGFEDPQTPEDAPGRESIEVRTLAFFPPGA
jgi:hypothetical protein